MKFASFPRTNLTRLYLAPFVLLTSLMLSLTAFSQTPVQLSLADILIGLRSKKVTLVERNKLLAEAVKVRGITFALTPEIEKELANTGADTGLIESIKQKSPVVKPSETSVIKPQPTPIPTPKPTPIPIDYQKRASSNIANGEYDLAIADLNKVIELKSADAMTYLNRGFAYHNKTSYDLAIADFDKAIELNPKDSSAYFNRGSSYEKIGNTQKALVDYQKAFELDATNEPAKNGLKRLQDEQAKQTPIQPKTVVIETPKTPSILNLGALNSLVVRLVQPIYPKIAQQSKIQGKVVVQVSLDEEGNVTSAKATEGPTMLRGASEDAARKSKFTPAKDGNQAVKSTGFLVYSFKAE